MLNGLFVAVVLFSILLAAFTGRMQALTQASMGAAKDAVTLALGLVGVMAFFLGLMRVAAHAGLLRILSRAIGPLLRRLVPEIPPDHPALSAMVLNIAANMLGLGNAATPFGIKAMMEMDRLNREKGTATNPMVLFLAINTAGLAVLPTSVLGMRVAAGSQDPAGILVPTWIASVAATVVGIASALILARLPWYRTTALVTPIPSPPTVSAPVPAKPSGPEAKPSGVEAEPSGFDAVPPVLEPPRGARWIALAAGLAFAAGLALHVARSLQGGSRDSLGTAVRDVVSFWLLPLLIGGLVLFGWARGVRVYDTLVEGAKEGFQVAVRIIPYLVAVLVMIGMFRGSGGLDALVGVLGPATAWIGMPAEALPMAILRPLSGSGAFAVMAEAMKTHGPDSLIGYLVSTLQGSTETTFYVLAVYFGAVGIRRTRHALPACLAADLAGVLTALAVVRLMFG